MEELLKVLKENKEDYTYVEPLAFDNSEYMPDSYDVLELYYSKGEFCIQFNGKLMFTYKTFEAFEKKVNYFIGEYNLKEA